MARSRALDYDDKRLAILKRSAQLFAGQGYERSSMAQLAASCGVSKALLYHYYDSKDALLFDVIYAHLQDLLEAVEGADDPALEPVARLRRLIGALLDAYRDANDEHAVQIAALKALPPDRQEGLKDLERRLVRTFSAAIAGINPALGGDSPLLKPVTMSLFGMLNWHYMWFRPAGPISREDYADLATRLIVEGARSLK